MCVCNGGVVSHYRLCGTRCVSQLPHHCPARLAAQAYLDAVAMDQWLMRDPAYAGFEAARVHAATQFHAAENKYQTVAGEQGYDVDMQQWADEVYRNQDAARARANVIAPHRQDSRHLLQLAIDAARRASCLFVAFTPDLANPAGLHITGAPAPFKAHVNAECLQSFCTTHDCRSAAQRGG